MAAKKAKRIEPKPQPAFETAMALVKKNYEKGIVGFRHGGGLAAVEKVIAAYGGKTKATYECVRVVKVLGVPEPPSVEIPPGALERICVVDPAGVSYCIPWGGIRALTGIKKTEVRNAAFEHTLEHRLNFEQIKEYINQLRRVGKARKRTGRTKAFGITSTTNICEQISRNEGPFCKAQRLATQSLEWLKVPDHQTQPDKVAFAKARKLLVAIQDLALELVSRLDAMSELEPPEKPAVKRRK